MVAAAVTSTDYNSFPPPTMDLNDCHSGTINRDDVANEGHSVDAPDLYQGDKGNINSETGDLLQTPGDVSSSPSETAGNDPPMEELNDAFSRKNDTDGIKVATNYSPVVNSSRLIATSVSEVEVTRSKSSYTPSEPSGDDPSTTPNVHWLNTEFARLVADKKKVMKTTKEMRKEIKEIGLGDVGTTSLKNKSLEDIMREYGLEPSGRFSHSSTTIGLKSAWMNTHKIASSITNVSQNNDTLLSSKSEIDDVKTNGSSVDDYTFASIRRPSRNTSFVNVTNTRESSNTYPENRYLSRTPSFSYYDFKNTSSATKTIPSSTNLDSLASSKASLEIKRSDERTLNPTIFFQRERERLQRLDSVINRTPKTSYTSIPRIPARDFTDSPYSSSYNKTLTTQPSSLYNVDPAATKFKDYGSESKDWGNSSPTRAYLQTASSSIPTMQYSPVSKYSQLESHDNPVYRDTSFSSPFSKKHYSRQTSHSAGRDQTNHASKSTRSQSNITSKTPTKQSVSSMKPTYKATGTNKTHSTAISSAYKQTPKAKVNKSKSSVTTNAKSKNLDEVDKEDFLARLMKNYSNSCMSAANKTQSEIGLTATHSKRDFDEWQEFDKKLERIPSTGNMYPKTTDGNRDDTHTKIKNGKYKPYQQSVSSLDKTKSFSDKPREVGHSPRASYGNAPTAWASSSDLRKYLDDDSHSLVRSVHELLNDTYHPTRNSLEANNFSDLTTNRDNNCTVGNYGSYLSASDGMNMDTGSKIEGMTSNFGRRNSAWSDNKDSMEYTSGDNGSVDLSYEVKNHDKKKSKNTVTKRSKSVPKKKQLKRK